MAACSIFFATDAGAWELWRNFAIKFVQADGRTIDFAANDQTTSEGQAYTLFFALVANDRQVFDRVLAWTENNLAGGDLSARLPAWSWGKRRDGSWGVLDANPASDADMWLAYTLIEAGRLWREPRFNATGEILLARIEKDEVIDLPGFGPMVKPGVEGFSAAGVYRLNPSYLPVELLRRFSGVDPEGPWAGIARNTLKLVKGASPAKVAPDWVSYAKDRGFFPDAEKGDVGSFDAIRVYLWAGMLNSEDELYRPLAAALSGMKEEVKKNLMPPAKVHAGGGKSEGVGPPGFSAALLPFLSGPERALQQKRLAASRLSTLLGKEARYYDQVLALFGEGWIEQRFSFALNGRLDTSWESHASR